MNLGSAAGAEAVPTSARFGGEAHDDAMNGAVDAIANSALPWPMRLSRWYDCAFKGKRSTVIHAAREFNRAEQPLTSSLIPA
jgi:hypothetical protein